MELRNLKTKKLISNDVFEAKSLSNKLFGLMGKSRDQTLMIRTRFGIHTFGMNHSIDVLVLDKQGKVVKLKQNLKPNRIFLWNPKYSTVLELPQGTIKQTVTKLGDKIS